MKRPKRQFQKSATPIKQMCTMMHLRIVCLSFGLDPDRFWLRQHRARRSSLVMSATKGSPKWWTLVDTVRNGGGCPSGRSGNTQGSEGSLPWAEPCSSVGSVSPSVHFFLARCTPKREPDNRNRAETFGPEPRQLNFDTSKICDKPRLRHPSRFTTCTDGRSDITAT